MNGDEQESEQQREVIGGVRRHVQRRRNWLRDGDPTLSRQFARVGVLGWTIVMPILLGLLLGHWIDRYFSSGILWSAALLFAGLVLGCWSAWKWMHKP